MDMKDGVLKKRIVVNKPAQISCGVCQKSISKYSLASHIKWNHQMDSDDYVKLHGEFRKKVREPSSRNLKMITCGICDGEFKSVGIFVHLRDTHSMSPDEYVRLHGEYRPSKIREIGYKTRLVELGDSEKQFCEVCNEPFASGMLLGGHIKKVHGLSKKGYIKKYVFRGIHPICLCGCGMDVQLLNYAPYKVNYRNGHNPNPMLGKKHKDSSKSLMSIAAISRIEKDIGKKTDTVPELKFKALLDKFDVKHEHPYALPGGLFDFYLTESNTLVEIDGTYWHPEKLVDLNFARIPNVISDYRKSIRPNLIRIREDRLDEIKTKEDLDNLKSFSFDYKYEWKFNQKVIPKEYFKKCLDLKGKDYLKSQSKLLLKFIRTFNPALPVLDLEESFADITSKIAKYDLSRIYNKDTNEFSNKGSSLGHNYLKHHFKSFWKSRFKKNPSPVDAWTDDSIMKSVIEYRIGVNNSNEIFDFSLSQLIRGLSARRITVSFFKPLLAVSIYHHYLGDVQTPTVLDPCCGFGGRLIGFKSKYPDGTYIGCEPNVETYRELVDLVKRENLTNVVLHNCKFEDYTGTKDVDLTFTSIPYYDLEVYSNSVQYSSFNVWKDTFIRSIESCKNCYINTSEDCSRELGWVGKIDSYITSNLTHFSDDDSDSKREVIVSL